MIFIPIRRFLLVFLSHSEFLFNVCQIRRVCSWSALAAGVNLEVRRLNAISPLSSLKKGGMNFRISAGAWEWASQ